MPLRAPVRYAAPNVSSQAVVKAARGGESDGEGWESFASSRGNRMTTTIVLDAGSDSRR